MWKHCPISLLGFTQTLIIMNILPLPWPLQYFLIIQNVGQKQVTGWFGTPSFSSYLLRNRKKKITLSPSLAVVVEGRVLPLTKTTQQEFLWNKFGTQGGKDPLQYGCFWNQRGKMKCDILDYVQLSRHHGIFLFLLANKVTEYFINKNHGRNWRTALWKLELL